MRERLPRVAAVFRAGDIDFRMFATIVYRTDLITDGEVLAAVDAELAVKVARWPSMTRGRLAGQAGGMVGGAGGGRGGAVAVDDAGPAGRPGGQDRGRGRRGCGAAPP